MEKGVTLIECLIVLTVIGIVSAMTAPSIRHQLKLRQLTESMDEIALRFRQARHLAVYTGQEHYVNFAMQENNWCILVSPSVCDCSSSGCDPNSILPPLTHNDSQGTIITGSSFSPSTHTAFRGTSGMAYGSAGTLNVSRANIQAKIVVSNLGRIRGCLINDAYRGYPAC